MSRTRPSHSLVLPGLVLLAGAALVGCSGQDDPAAGSDGAAAAGETDFCTAYSEAGGTLATPGVFQAGMPAEQTLADLTARIGVLDAVTPPDEIAADWQTLHELYSEVVTIAEQVPSEEPVVDPRALEVVGELSEPGAAVRSYLDESC